MRPPVTQTTILNAIKKAGESGITAAEIRETTNITRAMVSVTLTRIQEKSLAYSYGAATRMRYFAASVSRGKAKAVAASKEAEWQAERFERQQKTYRPPKEKPTPLGEFLKGWHHKPEDEEAPA